MVHRAHDTRNNEWTEFFYACRTSLRTEAGLDVAEFLLPLLVLDRLCFGNGQDGKILALLCRNASFCFIKNLLTVVPLSRKDPFNRNA